MTVPVVFPLAGRSVYVAGHRGLVGSSLVRRLEREDVGLLTATHAELDLTDQRQAFDWLAEKRPEVVIVAAAKVGGIMANSTRPAEFIYENLAIETNLIEGARRAGVAKLLFLGSSCIYPKFAKQPITEEALLEGALEPTNEWYAVAKIAGIKLCQAYRRQYGCGFISAMPTNLYGPWDNFDPVSSHVAPAMIRRLHEAKETGAEAIQIWGTGTPRREFLHVDDLADACVFLLERYDGEVAINVGTGEDVTINELVEITARVVGWQGRIEHLTDKPDGTPRKLLDVSRLAALGWRARIGLEEGMRTTYQWYLENVAGR
ncbi:MAG TPA: GDP-L-fucose synthase [Stellaceae bacterium]|nr:GDP-L-fucose synthase [Stellaceae bacterium]